MYNFKSDFNKVKKLTNNFRNINSDSIISFPRSILVLRLICCLTHLDLTEIYNKKYGKTVRFNLFESGTPVGKKISSRLAEIFSENIPTDISFESAHEKYNEIQRRLGKNRIKGISLENKLNNLFLKNDIKFERNVCIPTSSGIRVDVDFAIPSKHKTKVAIECKISRGYSGHDSFLKARVMALNSIELQEKNIKYISIVGGKWSPNALSLLNKYCHRVIKEPDFNQVLNALRT